MQLAFLVDELIRLLAQIPTSASVADMKLFVAVPAQDDQVFIPLVAEHLV